MSSNATHSQKRLDLQGLRAVAVLVVVLYHAGVPIPGGFVGVDVFFVLSGFLIIGLLVAEMKTHGRIDFGQFWAKRARRLVPASALVLVATLAVGSTVLSYFDKKALATDALWSALFSANWNYALTGDDYMNADGVPSAFRHFWSLAVEEQFYLLAPVLITVIGVVAFRRHLNPARAVGVFLSVVAVASLAYCVWVSFTNPSAAYYDTGARAWQLAAGGLLAVGMHGVTLTAKTATRFAAGGLFLLGLSLSGLSESGAFGLTYPSLLAVAPTAAALMLIAAGSTPTVTLRFLSWRPVTYIGDISYSLYLWHWPFLVLGWEVLGTDALGVSLALVAASVVASVVTFHGVENPVRNNVGLRVLTRPLVSVAMAASMVFVTVQISTQIRATELDTTRHATADQISVPKKAEKDTPAEPVFNDSVAGVRPALEKATTDERDMRAKGCQIGYSQSQVSDVNSCTFGNETSGNRVFIIGDSISSAVFPAVEKASGGRWSITVLAKSACTIADINRYRPEHPDEFWTECATWREDVIDVVLAQRPDLVIVGASENSLTKMVGTNGKPTARNVAAATRGMTSSLRRFQKAGIRTALVQSPAIAPYGVPDCLAKRLSVKKCSWKNDVIRTTDEVAKVMPQVAYIKTMDAYCSAGKCSPVVDRRVVFRDSLHFTKTFSKTLAPRFKPVLDAAVERSSST